MIATRSSALMIWKARFCIRPTAISIPPIQDVTGQYGAFALAGPKSRDLLKGLIHDAEPATALSNARFPWLSARDIELGIVPTLALRVTYTGELGWELHHPMEMQNPLFARLTGAGEPNGLRPVGARAQNWLRQEKSYSAFGAELGRDATPLEAGLDRFVDRDKDFRGKRAMEETGLRARWGPRMPIPRAARRSSRAAGRSAG